MYPITTMRRSAPVQLSHQNIDDSPLEAANDLSLRSFLQIYEPMVPSRTLQNDIRWRIDIDEPKVRRTHKEPEAVNLVQKIKL